MTRAALMMRGLASAAVALVATGCTTTAGHAPQTAPTTTTKRVIVQLVGPNGPEDQIVPARVTVPNVVGDSSAEANAAVTAAGLVPATNPTVCHSDTTAVRAKVERTVAGPGSLVARGSLVVFC